MEGLRVVVRAPPSTHMLFTIGRFALRSFVARRANWSSAALIALSTMMLLMVLSSVTTIARNTEANLMNSFVGHVQLFSPRYQGEKALYQSQPGALAMPIRGLNAVRAELVLWPHVARVTPMAVGVSSYSTGNLLDRRLEALRQAVNDDGAASPKAAAMLAQVQHIAQVLHAQLEAAAAEADPKLLAQQRTLFGEVESPELAARLAADSERTLEFLDTKLAPLLSDSVVTELQYLGLPLDRLADDFPAVELVDGTLAAQGNVGVLLSKFQYEEQFKLRVARRFDLMLERVKGGERIAESDELQRWAQLLAVGAGEVLQHLVVEDEAALADALAKALPESTGDARARLGTLLTVNDQTLEARHQTFMQVVAPRVELYALQIGETLVLRSPDQHGYVKARRVPLLGTFKLKGMPAAQPPSSAVALLDLTTSRDLLGYLTADEVAEAEALSQQEGVEPLTKEALGAKLRGETLDGGTVASKVGLNVLSAEALREGAPMNAAVWLDDPSLAGEMVAKVNALAQQQSLDVVAVDWRTASGYFADISRAASGVLWFLAITIYLVIGVVLMNTNMLVSLQRVKDLGILRAIGAQQRMVTSLVLVEAAVSVALFGGLGAIAGTAVMGAIADPGLDTQGEVLAPLFGGPLFQPVVTPEQVVLSLGLVLAVVLAAAVYPAVLASRVSPLEAMQSTH